MPSFSSRYGLNKPKEISFRDELPTELRIPIFSIFIRYFGGAFLRERIERVLNPYGIDPMPQPSVDIAISPDEDTPELVAIKKTLVSCPWFRIYDIIEDLYGQLVFYETELISDPAEAFRSLPFQVEINEYFVHAGIGWQLADGQIVSRGTEAFEATISAAKAALAASNRVTAQGHLNEALRDLSRRPQPDLSGAIYHAMGSLECVARDVTGDEKATLGMILKRNTGLVPAPLGVVLSQIWGYASNEARHVKEGQVPQRKNAALVVGLAAAVVAYLADGHKIVDKTDPSNEL